MTIVLLLLILAVLLFGSAAVLGVLGVVLAIVVGLIAVLLLAGLNWAVIVPTVALLGALAALVSWVRHRSRKQQGWAELLGGEWGGGPVPEDRREDLRRIYDERGLAAAIERHNRREP